VERSSYRYEPRPERNAALCEDLVKLARQKPRYGYRRLHALLSSGLNPPQFNFCDYLSEGTFQTGFLGRQHQALGQDAD
jgi:hypothetical protein